ncbi:hypothetical protein [Chitinophaga ginsengisegetis]|uniref:hypothetical protein n=1 Tax=Chitinophaga ginsengisegetis TaxID=393003 RepID=UPI000DBA8714|nr:hypothetical protein [Chitinophaga ginsengisegetis]MDR6566709.1 hypothetical protein [Chitinophaga ginsengisegetis]MDR6646439.1 hypothetical protein [Chitinophaga ginsengisegetis]MDR6652789.1 hypothetical protein [Chitinophaga ginsengisegetis]
MRGSLLALLLMLTVMDILPAQTKPTTSSVAWVHFGVFSTGIRVKYRVTPNVLERYWLDTTGVKIDTSVQTLSTGQWQRSRFVLDSIPSLLLTAGTTTYNWGCLYCGEQPVIIVEVGFTDKRPPMSYQIDADTSRIPAAIRNYVGNIKKEVSQLITEGNKKK